MEPEVHIIEKYFQVVLGCLIMTNVKWDSHTRAAMSTIKKYIGFGVLSQKVRSSNKVSWALRFTKFNLIGLVPFLIATVFYVLLFSRFGLWTWFLANIVGAAIHFSLVEYFNKTKKGFMFDEPKERKLNV